MTVPPTDPPRVPPPDRDGDTEERLLEAAHAVFLRRGTAGARMQEIAREAGVTHALLHYYFRSKDRLAEMVFQRAILAFFPALIALMASAEPIETKVERFVALEHDFLRRHPYLPGYLLAELAHTPARAAQFAAIATGGQPAAMRTRLLASLQAQLDAQAAAGTMRAMRAEQFMVNLLALNVFPFAARPMLAAVFGLEGDAFDAFLDERRATLAAFILAGMRP